MDYEYDIRYEMRKPKTNDPLVIRSQRCATKEQTISMLKDILKELDQWS